MWDGNLTQDGGLFTVIYWLSENQCGMETAGRVLLLLLPDTLSENQCGMETAPEHSLGGASFRVEREPMWDGNHI